MKFLSRFVLRAIGYVLRRSRKLINLLRLKFVRQAVPINRYEVRLVLLEDPVTHGSHYLTSPSAKVLLNSAYKMEQANAENESQKKDEVLEALRAAIYAPKFPAPAYLQVNVSAPHVASHFQGDDPALRERLAANLPTVMQAAQQVKAHMATTNSKAVSADVLDLGCGRGHWLALLKAANQPATGVDMAAECVQACINQGLEVKQGDALAVLKSTPPGSLAAVTAFHLIEQIPLAAQISLLADAYKALALGGLLLIETPNPENLAVIGRNFWFDSAQQRPVSAELLHMLALHAGFSAAHIKTESKHPPVISSLEMERYPLHTRHLLFCGQNTQLFAWK